MLCTSGTISCNGPGEVIMPIMIATAKSARPKMFQRVAALRPSAVPAATTIAAGKASSPVSTSPMPAGNANTPGSAPRIQARESPAAEYAVELKRDEPARRYLVEHLPDPLREQQQRTADDHRQEDRRWQHR
jgi:hypothetical protein